MQIESTNDLKRMMRDALIRGAFRSHSRAGGTCDAAYDWHLDPDGMAAIIHKDTHLECYAEDNS